MTENRLREMVRAAVLLDREIAASTELLKAMKKDLVREAETRRDECTPTDGGGLAWTVEGNDGCVARVNFPAPSLKASVDAEKPAGAKLMEMVGSRKDDLFTPVLRWEPVGNFRERVAELFDGSVARRIIRACETESAPRVSFETKDGQEKG